MVDSIESVRQWQSEKASVSSWVSICPPNARQITCYNLKQLFSGNVTAALNNGMQDDIEKTSNIIRERTVRACASALALCTREFEESLIALQWIESKFCDGSSIQMVICVSFQSLLFIIPPNTHQMPSNIKHFMFFFFLFLLICAVITRPLLLLLLCLVLITGKHLFAVSSVRSWC